MPQQPTDDVLIPATLDNFDQGAANTFPTKVDLGASYLANGVMLGGEPVVAEHVNNIANNHARHLDWLHSRQQGYTSIFEREDLVTGTIVVESYDDAGVLQSTSNSDDWTAAIQQIIDDANEGDTIWIPQGTFHANTVNIEDKVDLRICGPGTIVWGTADEGGFNFIGSCSRVLIDGLKMIGSNLESHSHRGVACPSNPALDLDQIYVTNCHIIGCRLSISVSADTSGRAQNIIVQNNYVEPCVGSAIGTYGIHAAEGSDDVYNVLIDGNTVVNAGRHAIYLARGRGMMCINNRIVGHRVGLIETSQFPAVICSRGDGVLIQNNTFTDSTNACIMAAPGEVGAPVMNVLIKGNYIFNHVGGYSPIMLGQDGAIDPTSDMRHVTVEDNCIEAVGDETIVAIRADFGHNIKINNNYISLTGATTISRCIRLLGRNQQNANFSSDWEVKGNRMHVVNAGGGQDTTGFLMSGDILGGPDPIDDIDVLISDNVYTRSGVERVTVGSTPADGNYDIIFSGFGLASPVTVRSTRAGGVPSTNADIAQDLVTEMTALIATDLSGVVSSPVTAAASALDFTIADLLPAGTITTIQPGGATLTWHPVTMFGLGSVNTNPRFIIEDQDVSGYSGTRFGRARDVGDLSIHGDILGPTTNDGAFTTDTLETTSTVTVGSDIVMDSSIGAIIIGQTGGAGNAQLRFHKPPASSQSFMRLFSNNLDSWLIQHHSTENINIFASDTTGALCTTLPMVLHKDGTLANDACEVRINRLSFRNGHTLVSGDFAPSGGSTVGSIIGTGSAFSFSWDVDTILDPTMSVVYPATWTSQPLVIASHRGGSDTGITRLTWTSTTTVLTFTATGTGNGTIVMDVLVVAT